MLLVCLKYDNYKYLSDKYPDNVNIVNIDDYKMTNGVPNVNYPINFLEELKLSESLFPVTVIDFQVDILSFLDAIKLKFYIVFNNSGNGTTFTNGNVEEDLFGEFE